MQCSVWRLTRCMHSLHSKVSFVVSVWGNIICQNVRWSNCPFSKYPDKDLDFYNDILLFILNAIHQCIDVQLWLCYTSGHCYTGSTQVSTSGTIARHWEQSVIKLPLVIFTGLQVYNTWKPSFFTVWKMVTIQPNNFVSITDKQLLW